MNVLDLFSEFPFRQMGQLDADSRQLTKPPPESGVSGAP